VLFKYLGIPMMHRRLRNSDWKVVEDRFEKKLSTWKGKLMSAGGRLISAHQFILKFPPNIYDVLL
jgi:hypothetical protein